MAALRGSDDGIRIQGQSLGPSRCFPSLLVSFSGGLSSWSQSGCQQHWPCILVSSGSSTNGDSFLNSSKSGLTGCYWNMYPFLGQSLWPGVLIDQAAETEGLRGTWLLSLCGISSYPSLRTHQDPRSVKSESESRSFRSALCDPHGLCMEFSRPEYWSG